MTINNDELSIYVLKFKDVHGIYKITNTINNKIYIGSAVYLYERWYSHKDKLNKNKHGNSHLQSAWNKYGYDNFNFEVIEIVEDKEILIVQEQYWMDKLNVCDRDIGYNLAPKAGSMLGYRHTKESLEKMSINRKGIGHSEETRLRMSISRKGLRHSEETKSLLSMKMKGRIISLEAREKISKTKTGKPGKKHTDETKQKISKSNKGNIMPKGENVANSVLTDKQVEEIKVKMNKGITNSELVELYSVSHSVISKIRNKKAYSHIFPDLDLNMSKRLSENEVIKIKELINNKVKTKEISELFGIAQSTVRSIRNGRIWTHVEAVTNIE